MRLERWFLRRRSFWDASLAQLSEPERALREHFRELVRSSGFFDKRWYLAHNPDIRTAGINPFDHFCLHGDREFRTPGPYFDGQIYASKWHDAKDSGMGPLEHFLKVGRAVGRDPPSVHHRARTKFVRERLDPIARLFLYDRTRKALQRECDTLSREIEDLELRYCLLKAAFDRTVAEADVVRKKLGKSL